MLGSVWRCMPSQDIHLHVRGEMWPLICNLTRWGKSACFSHWPMCSVLDKKVIPCPCHMLVSLGLLVPALVGNHSSHQRTLNVGGEVCRVVCGMASLPQPLVPFCGCGPCFCMQLGRLASLLLPQWDILKKLFSAEENFGKC